MKTNLFPVITLLVCILFNSCSNEAPQRKIISLNGRWQITDGTKDKIPSTFDHTVTVPGLVTLAKPAFVNPAPNVPDRKTINDNVEFFFHQKDTLRDVFWYHRTFSINQKLPEIALLKVGKAMFGTRVYLNGTFIGEHNPCFTPGYFDLKRSLRKGENELLISVGACRTSVPSDIPDGFDYEKERYIPGIFDNVELILSGSPYIRTVQVAPDVARKTAKIQAVVEGGEKPAASRIAFLVREATSGKIAGEYLTENITFQKGKSLTVNAEIPIKDCNFWAPENPFLYSLEVKTSSDSYQTRFGMRELRFDPVTHKAVLNGKPCFLRGTNITLYRFFEDPLCDSLPWDYNWVRKMHTKFRNDMNWNSFRNCIGFSPEEWYNIADEQGFMIQDEFPIWYGGPSWNKWVKKLNADELTEEFREWMEERWNHPSVVIWDADNETRLTEPSIDTAIARVRHLDLSGRSWDNSYSTNRNPGDIFESHPYHFSDPGFKLSDIAKADTIPQGNEQKNPGNFPVIINEYGWLWLNRDGSTTTLTSKLYENLLGRNSTAEQRQELYARYMAAETEFWRCHRNAAGVLHFTSLGYARPNGQTCDNWVDLATLKWEPYFLKYMHDAFSPICLMADFWDDSIRKGTDRNIPVIAINDLDKEWKGSVRFRILSGEKIISESSQDIRIDPYGRTECSFRTGAGLTEGNYTLEVALVDTPFGTIKSIRNFRI
jgi:beta-galactosidase